MVLGVINVLFKSIIVIFTLPINVLTLGLFTFVINAFLVILTGMVVPGFEVKSFLWALLFSLVLSIVHGMIHVISNKRNW